MVAGCPKCNARYRVNADQIGPDGAKLRCTKCSAVFLVRAAKAQAAPSEAPKSPPEPEPPSEPEVDSKRLVLIADPEESRGKLTAEAVRSWGLTAILVHDGVEAMLTIQRLLPAAIVLDAALPKMFGFQVCEVVKRNESLRETVVILVGAIHHQDRYRRDPSELYGADVYVESPDLPDGLLPLLRDAGLPVNDGQEPEGVATEPSIASQEDSVLQESPVASEPMAQSSSSLEPNLEPHAERTQPSVSEPEDLVEPEPEPAEPEPAPVSSLPAVDEDPERTAERERAHRLARIAVSEMVLYQPEKFDQASRDGVLEQTLDLEIQEARALLRQRIGEDVRAECDFIIEELHRVAADRSQ
jgi:predicted Zn finger-like uncharacterized protein